MNISITRLLSSVVFAAFLVTAFVFTSCSRMGMEGKSDAVSSGQKMDIVDTAVAAGSFNTLATALTEAGLVETLKGPGPFTVFAPTDEAFSKLPDGTLENLLKPANRDKLVSVLTYHVVAGEVMSDEVVEMDSAATVNGKNVSIKSIDGKVMIDKATVVKTDIKASNGVIHVIDEVLIP